jgi:glycosyltransferase involved in cell wall biosynthesis
MDKSKRVALYSNTWDASGGGGIVYVLSIAKLLSNNGFDVTVFFYETIQLEELHRRYETAGLKVKIQKRTAMPFFSQLYFAFKEWKAFDIVILQSIVFPRLTFVNKSFILCDFPMEKIKTLSEKFRLNSWKNIIVNSEYTKIWMRNYWKRESTVFYPPIDKPSTFNQTKNLDLVCVGRFNKGKRSKRQDIVIDVFKDLIAKGYADVNLHLIGYNQDNEYVNQLKESAKGFPVFFHENCSNENRIAILNQSAIYISACGFENNGKVKPMLVEHYGISVVEAMSYGCIPVVIGKGGHLETVDHTINGYHWNTKEELKMGLINLLDDTELRAKMSVAAYRKSENYSFSTLEEKLLQILNK